MTKNPNEGTTKVLQMRINPDGRWFKLHPKDLDLEHLLEKTGGHATVRLSLLLSRDQASLAETSGRHYHHVED